MIESPPTVAVVGASSDRAKFGNKAVRAYAAEGWTVYPINPKGGVIEGIEAVEDVRQVDRPIDRITIYLPPAVTLRLLPDLAEFSDTQIWFNPGSWNDEVIERATELALPFVQGCSIVDIGRSPSEFD